LFSISVILSDEDDAEVGIGIPLEARHERRIKTLHGNRQLANKCNTLSVC
jgi:hypothetical protein